MEMFFRGLLVFLTLLMVGCGSSNTAQNDRPTRERKAAEVNTQLGIEYLRRGDLASATQKLEKAIRYDDTYAMAHSVLGVLFQRISATDRAKEHFKKAIDLEPMNPQIATNYGQFLCGQGELQNAQIYFDRAGENHFYQSRELPYLNMAICAKKVGNAELAITYFRKALDVKPVLPMAFYQLADLYNLQENYSFAASYIDVFHRTGKPTTESLILAIQIHEKAGNMAQVSKYKAQLQSLPLQK